MELSPKAKAFRRKILTDREVRQAADTFKRMMGEPLVGAMARHGLSISDDLRFMAVATRLVEARVAKGLTLKTIAKQLGEPQYRIAEIERGNTNQLDVSLLRGYVDIMGLRRWFRQWETANRRLAERLAGSQVGSRVAGSEGDRKQRLGCA